MTKCMTVPFSNISYMLKEVFAIFSVDLNLIILKILVMNAKLLIL